MASYQFESWLCGHITSIADGSSVKTEEYTPQHPDFTDQNSSNVKKYFGMLCPRCYTEKMRESLQDIGILLIECHGQHDALVMAERKIDALTKYFVQQNEKNADASHPSTDEHGSFSDMMRNVTALADEACLAAIHDCVAIAERLDPGHTEIMLSYINDIRRVAVFSFESGNKAVRELIGQIMKQTEVMIDEIKALEESSARLFDALEPKWNMLNLLVGGRLGKMGVREP